MHNCKVVNSQKQIITNVKYINSYYKFTNLQPNFNEKYNCKCTIVNIYNNTNTRYKYNLVNTLFMT